jgi:hypothetical protein
MGHHEKRARFNKQYGWAACASVGGGMLIIGALFLNVRRRHRPFSSHVQSSGLSSTGTDALASFGGISASSADDHQVLTPLPCMDLLPREAHL